MTKIEKIHHAFETAGDELLATAKKMIDHNLIQKAERLKSAGFINSSEVVRSRGMVVSKEVADLIEHYQRKYPLNKFITKDQVDKINKKYGLACVPISNYMGFVPENKLKLIEEFKLDDADRQKNMIRVTKWSSPVSHRKEIRRIKRLYPGFLIPAEHARHNWVLMSGTYVYFSEYDMISGSGLRICAPVSQIDFSGIEQQVPGFWASVTHHEVPDPIVLQPVAGGYLIVAAWGDEASDEAVVNEIQN